MAMGIKGMLTVPTEDWVAELFSPPYLFIDPSRRAQIRSIRPVAANPGYQSQVSIGEKEFVLLHSNSDYRVGLSELPASCAEGQHASVVLIKLSSATHGWQNGQQFVELAFTPAPGSATDIVVRTPDARAANLPPAYYMLFYVDCHGKPAVARMVRFDDQAKAP